MADTGIGRPTHAGAGSPSGDAPSLPPILTAHACEPGRDVFREAVNGAKTQRLEAGDCLWSLRTARAEFAIVLEPDVASNICRQMGPLMFAGINDSLGALMPPKTGVLWRWPDTILINGAAAGSLSLAIAPTPPDTDDPPDWLVVACSLRLQRGKSLQEPGDNPDITVIHEEGGGDLERSALIQSVASHFLTWLNTWQDDGFAVVHDNIIGRIEGYGHDPADIRAPDTTYTDATVLGLSEDADLLIKAAAGEHHAVPLTVLQVETESGGGGS